MSNNEFQREAPKRRDVVVPPRSQMLSSKGKPQMSVTVGKHKDDPDFDRPVHGMMPSRASPAYGGGSKLNFRGWNPANNSADDDIEPSRETLVARSKDLIRNYEIAGAAVDQDVDHIVGCDFRLSPTPITDCLEGWDIRRTSELVNNISTKWKIDASSRGNWFDPAGELSFVQILSQHVRAYRVFGESFAVFYFMNRDKPHSTAAAIIDPSRVNTPDRLSPAIEEQTVAGIRKSRLGYPIGYFVQNNHPNECPPPGQSATQRHEFIRRRTQLGRDQIIHSFIPKLPGQSRGVPPFASALKRLKKLEKYEDATINAAVLHATIAATIESDYSDAGTVLGQNGEGELVEMSAADHYMAQCGDYAKTNQFTWDDVLVPRLWNGEKLNLQSPGQPTAQFEAFERAMVKHFARAMGSTFEWTAGDWSTTNYSGARAGLISIYASINCHRANVANELANALYCAWLEDNISTGRIVVPGFEGRPDEAWVYFLDNKDELSIAEWHGPVREEIDRSKQMDFYTKVKKLNCGTKRDFCNQVLNQDHREVLRQQLNEELEEKELREEMGLPQRIDEQLETEETDDEPTSQGDEE